MAKKQGSAGPKERINIRYKPITGDAREQVELPLKVLVTGDFTGRESEVAIEDREVLSVDKSLNGIDKAMASHNITLDFLVKDTLSKEGGEMPVHLKIRDMHGFSPDAVADNVPALKKLMELRDAIEKLRGPLGNVPEFRNRLNAILGNPKHVEEIMRKLQGREMPLGGP